METGQYDIAIIGGGILGLSTAMQLAASAPSWKVAVLEKEDALATHQTGHNSGVMHSGIYYRPGSHKARFCVAGLNNLVRFCEENEIDYQQCGKVIVATNESELGRLQDLYERGTANGVPDLELVGPERLKEIEPYTVGVQALWAPHTGIVDFTKVAAAYADKFQQAGGNIFTGAPVKKIVRSAGAAGSGGAVALETPKGTLQAKHIINCGGLYADRVAEMTGEKVGVRIIPFRGEYYTLRPESHNLVSGLIYPVPDPRFPFLGVHFTRNIHGSVEAGPNAVLALRREGYRKRDFDIGESLGSLAYPGFWKMAAKFWKIGMGEVYRSFSKRVFLRDLQRLLPEIKESDLASGGSGVRAQAVAKDGTLLDDFSIIQGRDAIHVLNAPSPGATSSLAIGEHIAGLAVEQFGGSS
ncbi:MAG: L-2-hydroxyglutarate oxidase [Chloroflexi bacterium]|nr:L-2-hydroxyglutarate oxidase [Chloroflexota bacterium]MDA1270240.1 L-2-hydroxyglutarate oxidase [Chloroflexota bacterium]PKB59607.1 MAG: hydroxyglutarate oxidase [SAR202 cluster bacterium Casp-Chloro-G2]